MLDIKFHTDEKQLNEVISREEFVDFLYNHLGNFGDPKAQINKAIDYSFSEDSGKGGFLATATYEKNIVGALVMNKTGMDEYIPENILVYVAVDASYRNKGFGKEIVSRAIAHAEGNVALHVEYDNPAKRLYERLGFSSKYAEMRFNK